MFDTVECPSWIYKQYPVRIKLLADLTDEFDELYSIGLKLIRIISETLAQRGSSRVPRMLINDRSSFRLSRVSCADRWRSANILSALPTSRLHRNPNRRTVGHLRQTLLNWFSPRIVERRIQSNKFLSFSQIDFFLGWIFSLSFNKRTDNRASKSVSLNFRPTNPSRPRTTTQTDPTAEWMSRCWHRPVRSSRCAKKKEIEAALRYIVVRNDVARPSLVRSWVRDPVARRGTIWS